MKRFLCILLILCLFPIPVNAITWQQVKNADAYLKTKDGQVIVVLGIIGVMWIKKMIFDGPGKYIYKNGKFRPYTPKAPPKPKVKSTPKYQSFPQNTPIPSTPVETTPIYGPGGEILKLIKK